jgi:hypothetical protein
MAAGRFPNANPVVIAIAVYGTIIQLRNHSS